MKHQQGHSRAGSNRQLESIAKSQAFGGAFPLQKKNIFFSFYLTKAEALGLRWEDLDFENKTITIIHSLGYVQHNGSREVFLSSPKTEAGKENLPCVRIKFHQIGNIDISVCPN